jgi:hypothetical protein
MLEIKVQESNYIYCLIGLLSSFKESKWFYETVVLCMYVCVSICAPVSIFEPVDRFLRNLERTLAIEGDPNAVRFTSPRF